MHWITITGIILIASGTILTCFGQSIRNRLEDKHRHESVSQKTSQIDELTRGNKKLLIRIDEYQKSLSERDEIIQQLEAQVNEPDITLQGQHTGQQTKDRLQVLPKSDTVDAITQAKKLCNQGEYDKAYKIADDLRQKNPDLGLAYFILGTIEMRREHYEKGEEQLKWAVQLGLPDEDMAWAYHNLGISLIRKKDTVKAKEFLEKAVELNSDMEKSRKALRLLNDYLRKK